MSSARSAPAPSAPGKARWLLALLGGLVLTVCFYSPVRDLAGVNLDGANHSSYAYFTAHHFQYGSEVVTMAGPYGFVLYGWTYGGELFWARVAGQLVLNTSFAALLLGFAWQHRRSWLAWLWLAAQVAFTPFHDDLPVEWSLLLAGLFLVTERRGRAVTLAVVALLAFLSLIKGTQLALGLATLGVAVGAHAWRREWRAAATLAAGYFAALLALWLLAGQNPLHLPAYFRGALELAGGYNDAMSLEETPALLLRGVLVSAALVAALGWALWHRRRDVAAVASLLLLAGHAFVQWKHGFVRADGHAFIYFHFALVAALTIQLVAWPAGSDRRWPAFVGGALVLAMWVLSCAGPRDPKLPDLPGAAARVRERLAANFAQLRTLPATRADFDHRVAEQRQFYAMPLTRRAVGDRPVDLFGYEHNRVTLNALNYRPRPMSGGPFNVYTPALMQLNADFLRDPARRPDFYLVRLETIDGRFLAQDDGLVLQALPYLYQPVLVEQNHLLLQARPGAAVPAPRALGRVRAQIGDTIPVPATVPGELVLARIEVQLSWLGHLRAMLYKVPRLRLGLRGAGLDAPEPYRLVRVMAASPFLLSPVLAGNADLVDLYAGRAAKAPRDLRVSTSDRTWFQREIEIEFLALPAPPPAPAGVDLPMLRYFAQTPWETVDTAEALAGTAEHIFGLAAHTPAQFSWALDGRERTVSFGYGLVPAAYGTTTDGVEFTFTLLRPGQPPLPLFRTFLNPRDLPAHRGHRRAAFDLPLLPPGSRLEFTAHPGPHGNNAFDWAYLSELRFNDAPAPASGGGR